MQILNVPSAYMPSSKPLATVVSCNAGQALLNGAEKVNFRRAVSAMVRLFSKRTVHSGVM